jgi:putative membrane protein
VWGLTLGEAGTAIKIFILACAITAGVFGALTASRKILWIQAMTAVVALALVIAS